MFYPNGGAFGMGFGSGFDTSPAGYMHASPGGAGGGADPFDQAVLHGLSEALCMPDLRNALQAVREVVDWIMTNRLQPQQPQIILPPPAVDNPHTHTRGHGHGHGGRRHAVEDVDDVSVLSAGGRDRDGRRGGRKAATPSASTTGRRKAAPLKRPSSTHSNRSSGHGHGKGRGDDEDEDEVDEVDEDEDGDGSVVRTSPADRDTIEALQRTVDLLRLEIDTYKGREQARDERVLSGDAAPAATVPQPAAGAGARAGAADGNALALEAERAARAAADAAKQRLAAELAAANAKVSAPVAPSSSRWRNTAVTFSVVSDRSVDGGRGGGGGGGSGSAGRRRERGCRCRRRRRDPGRGARRAAGPLAPRRQALRRHVRAVASRAMHYFPHSSFFTTWVVYVSCVCRSGVARWSSWKGS
jgi:hypothetical protein